MNNLFILGAGASRLAGGPLMGDFLDNAEDILRRQPRGIEPVTSEFEDVFKAIHELNVVHAKSYLDLNNIEVVFGAIDTALFIEHLGNRSPESIRDLRNAIITLIYKTLEECISFPVKDNSLLLPTPYDEFSGLLKSKYTDGSHRYSFITLNYDLCLDVMLEASGIGFDYFLSRDYNGDTPLLKLHGSMNWALSDDNLIIPYTVNEFYPRIQAGLRHSMREVHLDIGSHLNLKTYKGKPLHGPPVIVPPTWNKRDYSDQLGLVWSKAATEFGNAENIFVIGYSLPEADSFFRYLYALGSSLGPARIRNFIVINPDTSGQIEARFRALIGKGIENRFKYFAETFDRGLRRITHILNNS